MRPASFQRSREWRTAFAVLSLYSLVFQAILGGFALGAPMRIGDGEKGIICSVDAGVLTGKNPGARDRHGQDCPCPGLCGSLAATGVDGALSLATAPWPRKHATALIVPSLGDLRARPVGGASLARAPPRLSSRFATA
jgi:hypothetical protein